MCTLVGLPTAPSCTGTKVPQKAEKRSQPWHSRSPRQNSLLEELAEGGGEPLLVHVLDADGGHRGADEGSDWKKRGGSRSRRSQAEVVFKAEPGPVAGGPLRGRQEKERSKQLKKQTTKFQQKRDSAATEKTSVTENALFSAFQSKTINNVTFFCNSVDVILLFELYLVFHHGFWKYSSNILSDYVMRKGFMASMLFPGSSLWVKLFKPWQIDIPLCTITWSYFYVYVNI